MYFKFSLFSKAVSFCWDSIVLASMINQPENSSTVGQLSTIQLLVWTSGRSKGWVLVGGIHNLAVKLYCCSFLNAFKLMVVWIRCFKIEVRLEKSV